MSVVWAVLSPRPGMGLYEGRESLGEEVWEACMEGISFFCGFMCYLLQLSLLALLQVWVLAGNVLGVVAVAQQFRMWKISGNSFKSAPEEKPTSLPRVVMWWSCLPSLSYWNPIVPHLPWLGRVVWQPCNSAFAVVLILGETLQ